MNVKNRKSFPINFIRAIPLPVKVFIKDFYRLTMPTYCILLATFLLTQNQNLAQEAKMKVHRKYYTSLMIITLYAFSSLFCLCKDSIESDTVKERIDHFSLSQKSSKELKSLKPTHKANIEGHEIVFEEIATLPYGDCGFEVLGIERKTAVRLLLDSSDDPIIRGLLIPEIKAAFHQAELEEILHERTQMSRVSELLEAYKVAHDPSVSNPESRADFERVLDEFCSEKAVLESYVSSYYGGGGWLTIIPNCINKIFIPGNTSALDALARLTNINCFVWQVGKGITLELMHKALFGIKKARDIHMLHTYTQAEKKTRNHFTRLEKASLDQVPNLITSEFQDSGRHNNPQLPAAQNDKESEKQKKGFLVTLRNVGNRIVESNNRSLGTLFGCIAGFTASTILVSTNAPTSFQIFGNLSSCSGVGSPEYLIVIYKVCGVLLSTGVGGNLSSYIGASIDILTGERTIFDAIHYLKNLCYKKTKKIPEETKSEERIISSQPPSTHRHFPYITSNKATLEEHKHYSRDQPGDLMANDEILEYLLSIYHDSSNKQNQIDKLLREIAELRDFIDQLKEQKRKLEEISQSSHGADRLAVAEEGQVTVDIK